MKKTCILAIFLIVVSTSAAQSLRYRDTTYHFSFSYPAAWQIESTGDENLMVMISSPKKDYLLVVYAFFLDEAFVDIEKLAEDDKTMFRNLGPVSSEEVNTVIPYVGEYIDWMAEGAGEIIDIRKNYYANESNQYARAYFTVDEHYAYVLILYSQNENIDNAEAIFDSFGKEAGWLTKWRNNLSWAYQRRELIAALMFVVSFLYLSALAFSGRGVRKWFGRIRALQKFRKKLKEGESPDSKWQYAYRRSGKYIMIYFLLFLFLSVPAIIIYAHVWAAYIAPPVFFLAGYYGYKVVIKTPD
jgi:hypothetical protein